MQTNSPLATMLREGIKHASKNALKDPIVKKAAAAKAVLMNQQGAKSIDKSRGKPFKGNLPRIDNKPLDKEAGLIDAAKAAGKVYSNMNSSEQAAVHAIGGYVGNKLLDKVKSTKAYKGMTKGEKKATSTLSSYAKNKLTAKARQYAYA